MLEIGTILYLKQGGQKLMIISRGPIIQAEDKKIRYDYSACLYPLGFLQEQTFYFNEENIDKVLYKGFRDEEEDRFETLYNQWLCEEGSKIEKGLINMTKED